MLSEFFTKLVNPVAEQREQLMQQPVAIRCPRCHRPMRRFHATDDYTHTCDNCGGLYAPSGMDFTRETDAA